MQACFAVIDQDCQNTVLLKRYEYAKQEWTMGKFQGHSLGHHLKLLLLSIKEIRVLPKNYPVTSNYLAVLCTPSSRSRLSKMKLLVHKMVHLKTQDHNKEEPRPSTVAGFVLVDCKSLFCSSDYI